MAEYETFYGRDIQADEEFEIDLIDRDTRESFRARVRATRDPNALPGSNPLFARDHLQANIAPAAGWYVQILQRLDEDEDEDAPAVTRKEIPIEERHGFLLRSLLEERSREDEKP